MCNPPVAFVPEVPRDWNRSFDVTQTEVIGLDDARCSYGGIKVKSWTDRKNINGIYTEGEDTDYSEKISCYAIPSGNMTTLTQPGDFKVIATDVTVGDTDCPQGGKKYESFIDTDGNNLYDSKIDTNYNSKKICNGLNETASLSGGNGIILTNTLATGDSQCPTGGAIASFLT